MIKSIKAVIFDMDGLMIDSERITFEEYRDKLKEMDLVFDENVNNRCLGKNKQGIFQVFFEQYGTDFPMESVWDQVHENIDYRIFNEWVVKEGLIELLKFLKMNNIKTCVATSSNRDRVNKILKAFELDEYFNDSVCGNEIKCGKPNPEIFLTACKKLQVLPKDAIILEDSESGIQAGYDGGMRVVAIPDMKYPDKIFVDKTEMIVTSLNEFLDILKKA